jgi:tungstate transport system ATP-binding protein
MEINYLTNHLAIIVNGEVKQYGPTQEVLEHPNSATSPFLNEWKKFYPMSFRHEKPLSLMS